MVKLKYVGNDEWKSEDSKFLFRRNSKPEGLVINKLFENALLSFQGAVWTVSEYPEQQEFSISKSDWLSLRNKIIDNLRPYTMRPENKFSEDPNEIKIFKPNSIKLRLHEKMKFFKCSRGHVNSCTSLNDVSHCKTCNDKEMSHIPIFIKKYNNLFEADRTLNTFDPHSIYIDITSPQVPSDSKVNCPSCGNARKLISKSSYFPVESLVWSCEECGQETQFRKPYTKSLYYFKVDFPYDNLFRGLVTRQSSALVKENLESTNAIVSTELNFIKNIFYSDQINIYDVCFGCLSNDKLFLFEHGDQNKLKIYARKFDTHGIIFEFDEDVFEKSAQIIKDNLIYIKNDDIKNKLLLFLEDEKLFKITLLHTFKHVMLYQIPFLVGIEASKVSGDYNYGNTPNVVLFDNESGGIGVFQTLQYDLKRFAFWLNMAKNSVKNCKRDPHCSGGCKLCSFIENCGNINQNLNRYLLFPMFKLDFRDQSNFQ